MRHLTLFRSRGKGYRQESFGRLVLLLFRTFVTLIPLHHLLEPVVPLIALISGVAFTERFSFHKRFSVEAGHQNGHWTGV